MPSLEDALAYARAGRAIFPCYEVMPDGSCACGEPDCRNTGKHPYGSAERDRCYNDTRGGCKMATSDESQIRIWWTRWPNANIAMATGPINHLVCFDFDGEKGLANYSTLMNGTRPEDTLSVDTPGGGLHTYFKTDESFGNRRNLLGPDSSVDVRGHHGYTMVPPSNHKSGGTYQWHTKRKPIPLPGYLARKLGEIDEESPRDPIDESDWTRVVNDGEGRDDYLIRMAGSLARSKLPYRELAKTLWGLNRDNVKPPKDKRAIIRIAKSAIRMEKARIAREGDYTPAEIIQESEAEENEIRKGFLLSSRQFEERYAGLNIDWLVKDWIPEASLGMLLAPPETFKTWIMVDLLCALSGSKPLFLDHFPVLKTGTCLFFQQEDSFARLWERVAAVLNVPAFERHGNIIEIPTPPDYPKILWHVDRELNMKNKEALVNLDRSIRKYKPIFCGIDPMYALMELKDYGAETAKELMLFKSMRDYHGLTFLIAHHMKKGDPTGGRARDYGWGSQFLNAAQEFGIELIARPKDGLLRVERHEKNSQRPPLIDVQLNIQPYSYSVDIEEVKETAFNSNLDSVRELILTEPIKSYTQIMKTCGITSRATLNEILKELGAEKKEGFYRLPEKDRLTILQGGLNDDVG
jgi:hypothetical protein